MKILQEGAFQRLIKRLESNGDSREEIKDCLVNILAHVFTRKPLPLYNDYDVDLDDAVCPAFTPDLMVHINLARPSFLTRGDKTTY